MTVRWQNIGIDTTDPEPIARWWAEFLGWRITYQSEEEVVLEPPEGSLEDGSTPTIFFTRVPEKKIGKNRIHLDLRPEDQDAEVARAEAMGAIRTDVGQGEDVTWVVMADPDGNEFCILRAFTDEELADRGEG